MFDIGLFDENLRFWQEYEPTIRLAQRKPFYFVNEVLVAFIVLMKMIRKGLQINSMSGRML